MPTINLAALSMQMHVVTSEKKQRFFGIYTHALLSSRSQRICARVTQKWESEAETVEGGGERHARASEGIR